LPPVFRVLLHPPGSKMMEQILLLADGAEVTAEVQQDGFYGTGSGINTQQQWFHDILSNKETRQY